MLPRNWLSFEIPMILSAINEILKELWKELYHQEMLELFLIFHYRISSK